MSSKKTIGFYLSSTGFGGLELNAINLAKWLNERNWEVIFFTTEKSRIASSAMDLGIKLEYIQRPYKYVDIPNALKLSKLIKAHGIKNLIVFDNYDLSTANFCKQLFNKTLNMLYLQQMQFKVKKTSPAHTFRFSGLNYWISPLPSLKKQVLKTTKVPESKIKIIPLCLETDRFVNNPIKKEEARELLNIDSKSTLIGVLGRIAPTKGQLEVIKAFKELSSKHANLELLIMGEATINEAQCVAYEKECYDYVKKNGLESKVHFKPFRKDVEVFYSAIDIFLMPSKKETFGMVTVEAMLSAKPVIGTNSGGTPELLDFGKLGQLFEYQNQEDLTLKIENIILDKYNFQEQVINAKSNAINNYDSKMMCDSIETLLI